MLNIKRVHSCISDGTELQNVMSCEPVKWSEIDGADVMSDTRSLVCRLSSETEGRSFRPRWSIAASRFWKQTLYTQKVK